MLRNRNRVVQDVNPCTLSTSWNSLPNGLPNMFFSSIFSFRTARVQYVFKFLPEKYFQRQTCDPPTSLLVPRASHIYPGFVTVSLAKNSLFSPPIKIRFCCFQSKHKRSTTFYILYVILRYSQWPIYPH